MLVSRHLTKSFGRLRALDDVGVSMERGQSVLLIGPNGSGKTTFIKCVLGLVIPDKGELTLDGDACSETRAAPQHRLHAADRAFSGPPQGRPDHRDDAGNPPRRHARSDEDLIEAFEIGKLAHKTARTLSGGMRQKLSACLAFLFDPEILILDEPTAGLDPVAAEILKEKVRAERAKNKLILLTSHILSDLDEITSDVLYLIDGRVRFYRPIAELSKNTAIRNSDVSSPKSCVKPPMLKIVKYVIRTSSAAASSSPMRLILLAASFGLFNLGGDVSKGLIGMLSLVLLVVPLVCLVFGTIHFYNSYEFIELLASQPLKRRTILLGEYLGVARVPCAARCCSVPACRSCSMPPPPPASPCWPWV
jgi:Cu-processing system ATP-binding protein